MRHAVVLVVLLVRDWLEFVFALFERRVVVLYRVAYVLTRLILFDVSRTRAVLRVLLLVFFVTACESLRARRRGHLRLDLARAALLLAAYVRRLVRVLCDLYRASSRSVRDLRDPLTWLVELRSDMAYLCRVLEVAQELVRGSHYRVEAHMVVLLVRNLLCFRRECREFALRLFRVACHLP